ncbi:MAG: Ig-like domain-containing protein, partial [Alphaproteobacteria bacterium]
ATEAVTTPPSGVAPTVTIMSPAPAAEVTGEIAVTADPADSDGTVVEVDFLVGGVSIGKDTSSEGGWSVQWDTTAAGNGGYTITAVAKDDSNMTGDDAINVTVNNDNGGGGGGDGDMYVSAIDWGQKNFGRGGGFHDLITTVAIGSVDGAVSAASVSMTLCWVGTGSNCWNFGGDTDGSGQVKFTLKRAPDGNYTATVTSVTHATYNYDPALDTGNPASTNFPL